MIFSAIFVMIAAYLIGSVNFAVIFASAFLKKDVRKLGSGNAGTTNVMRTAGFLPGILTFVFDVLKGVIACLAGSLVFNYIYQNTSYSWALPIYGAYICGLLCMIGHVFPIFFQFKGGKGVAVSVGIYAVCCWQAMLIAFAVFIIIVLLTRYVSLGSVIATVSVIVLVCVFYNRTAILLPQLSISIIMSAFVIFMHKGNIKRLLTGEESKIHIRRG